ncbi:MAG: hypothetical protein CL927_08855 [Deltaproteobacteria bacterium]|nr:hypothetical protein [Deltaproteobacteria bacterium]HCH66707.1 hypothetical protein [Deltaproteobacteria bacterium]
MGRKVSKQADTEALESQAAIDLELTLNEDDRFGVDAWSKYNQPVEIKSLNFSSKSPAVQFAHNNYPDKYDSFLKQHCLVVLHHDRKSVRYFLLRKGESGFWTQWVLKCKIDHGREELIVRRMQKLYKENFELDDFSRRIVERTIPGAVLTKKQWSFSIKYLFRYGEEISRWPDLEHFDTPPTECRPENHPRMFIV